MVRCLERAERALLQVENAMVPSDLRESWEDFLEAFSKAIGKLISLSKSEQASRSFGHKLKNASASDDEGLVFLREARNTDVHGLEPSASYEAGLTTLFGAFGLGPNCTDCYFSDNVINGGNTGTFIISTDEFGKICKLVSDSPIFAHYTPASIMLKSVYSSEKKKSFGVPSSLNGSNLKNGSPLELGRVAIDFLETKIEEFKQIQA